ncbi:MAG: AsmA family protein [Pseudomonadota bacterium]
MIKWIFRLLGAVVLVIIVATGALFLLPGERVAQVAADQLRVITGRDVQINGDVSMTFWPVLGANVGGLEVGNAEWSEQGPMLTAENASIGVEMGPLLGGEIRITHIRAQSPTIRLQSKSDGRASWQFTDATGEAQIETETSPETERQALSIAKLEVTDATLIYDAEGADVISYSNVDLTLDWPDRDGPAKIDAKLEPAGTPVTLTADIAGFGAFLNGDPQVVDAVLRAGGGQATLIGDASLDGAVNGKLALNMPSTDGFLKALGLPGAALPAGLGQSVDLGADLTLTRDRALSLRNLVAGLGAGNALRGQVDVSLNGVPQVNASLNAGALDLKGLTQGSGGDASGSSSAGSGNASGGWSKAPIDASGLAAFNGRIALSADAIDLGSLRLGATDTVLTNDTSRMVFTLNNVVAYEGALAGEFVINNRNGLSVGGGLTGSSLQMQPMLSDLMGVNRLTGAANARMSFLGVGQSIHAIMNSLRGDGSLKIGRGTIQGLDLDRLMGSGTVGGGTTIFNELSATYDIQNGNLTNRDLLLSLASYEATGEGRVGLGAQDIDYIFTPRALKLGDGKGVAIPVRIRGPWAKPQIVPDLSAAIELNFEEEIKEIEQKAKEEVKKAEDKIKKDVEDKIKEELGNTLKNLFD